MSASRAMLIGLIIIACVIIATTLWTGIAVYPMSLVDILCVSRVEHPIFYWGMVASWLCALAAAVWTAITSKS